MEAPIEVDPARRSPRIIVNLFNWRSLLDSNSLSLSLGIGCNGVQGTVWLYSRYDRDFRDLRHEPSAGRVGKLI